MINGFKSRRLPMIRSQLRESGMKLTPEWAREVRVWIEPVAPVVAICHLQMT
jgi:hypothetical protein